MAFVRSDLNTFWRKYHMLVPVVGVIVLLLSPIIIVVVGTIYAIKHGAASEIFNSITYNPFAKENRQYKRGNDEH